MKMKLKSLILIMLVSLLLITACSGTQKNAVKTGSAFLGGVNGLTASFEPLSIKENNIYTVFNTEDFPLEVNLKNKGEEDISPGKVSLKLLGPAKTDFQNIPQWTLKNVQIINKMSEFNPEGGEEIVSFTPNKRALYTAPIVGFNDITWNLEYTYEYKTHLIVNDVCFKGDLTQKTVCEVKEKKVYSVSGAPITVTGITEDSGGKGIVILKIEIQDSGKGDSTVIGKDFDNRFGQITYTIDEPQKWECKSGGRENEARLIGKRATIICRSKVPLTNDDLYVKNVRLDFSYLYKELIREKLRVKESVK